VYHAVDPRCGAAGAGVGPTRESGGGRRDPGNLHGRSQLRGVKLESDRHTLFAYPVLLMDYEAHGGEDSEVAKRRDRLYAKLKLAR
jgi:hypothetical protein